MARKIYGVDDDGNQLSMTVSDNCTVSIEDIPINQEYQLQMVSVNGEIEVYGVDGVIIRPNRPPRR